MLLRKNFMSSNSVNLNLFSVGHTACIANSRYDIRGFI